MILPTGTEAMGRTDSLEAWADFFARFPNYQFDARRYEIEADALVLIGDASSDDIRLSGPTRWTVRVVKGAVHEWAAVARRE